MKNNKNIILTGFMGTGKTTAARLVSKDLNRQMIDVDALIEIRAGMKISDIFNELGETRFRDIESECIASLADLTDLVIATGGGAVLREENIRNLRKNGIIILLRAKPEIILRNTSGNADRPLLSGDSNIKKIHELLKVREQYYRNCDFEIDVSLLSPYEAAEAIKKISEKA